MPIYAQIILLFFTFIFFVFLAMYLSGLGMRRICFKIIAEMEEARAFSEKRAVKLQDERRNIFRVGTKNLRPRALNVLISEKLVIKAANGRYYLDKDKVASLKNK